VGPNTWGVVAQWL